MDRITVNSYWPALDDLQVIGSKNATRLSSRGIKTPRDLLRVIADDQGHTSLLQTFEISENALYRWMEVAELAGLKGMGTRNADLLTTAGIHSVRDLSEQDSKILYDRLCALGKSKHQRAPREEIVRVWIREAQRRMDSRKLE
jgi:hypothetical protein